MPAILEALPALYGRLLPDLFTREVPAEEKATCGSCAMCEGGSLSVVDGVEGSRVFRPDTKCCTFHPRLPNFLVGAIFADPDPALEPGRARLRKKLQARVGVTPMWVKAPARYDLMYQNSRRSFGRAGALLCPYFEPNGGLCTIWRYREAVCSTFFCKHVAAADGRAFWMGVKGYLAWAELQLARLATLELLPDFILEGRDKENANAPLTAEDLDERGPSEAAYKLLWGAWAGREEEYYRRCYEQVQGISREQLALAMGLDGQIELRQLERLYARATKTLLPNRLKLNPNATVKWLDDGSVGLAAYSEYDAIALPGPAYPLLVAFTGREPVAAVRAKLRQERGQDLGDEVLAVLYQHRILVEA